MFQLMELLYAFQEIKKWNACSGIIYFKLLYALAHDFLVNVATWILNGCSTSVAVAVKWNHYAPSWLHLSFLKFCIY